MELFRWRVMHCLMVVAVAALLVERGHTKPDGQRRGSGGADGFRKTSPGQAVPLAAKQLAGDVTTGAGHSRQGQERRENQHQRKAQQQHRERHPQSQQRQQATHRSGAGPKPELPPQLQPHNLRSSSSDDGEAHDLLDCQPEPGDKLLARSVVKAEFRPLGFSEASWFYPQNGQDRCTIHCVRVLDQRRDSYGGYPRIARGGVGHHYVELSFKSDFSRGFHFVVEVYGQ